MATVAKTFGVRNGLDVANTIVLDSNRNLSNIANANIAGYVNANSTLAVTGDVTVNANKFIVHAANGDVTLAGNIRVNGNNINNSDGNTLIKFVGGDVYLPNGALDIYSGELRVQGTTFAQATGQNVEVKGDLTVSGGDIVSTAIANVVNVTSTTVNFAGEATTINVGSTTGNTLIRHSLDVAKNVAVSQNLTVSQFSKANAFVSTSLNVVPPNLANTNGERVRLYDFEQAGRPNYAIGVESGHIWMGIDGNANNLGWKWYGNTSLAARLSGNGSLEVANSVVANQFLTVDGLDITGQANAARAQANTARDQANTARDTANGAYSQANGAYAQANGAYAQANGAYAQANGAFAQANGAYAQANGAYDQANTAANTIRVYANSAGELSNKFLNFINTTSIQVTVYDNLDGNANIAFNTTGAAVADAYAQANVARDTANDAYGQANAAYAEANLKLNLTGGTINGSLNISGNLAVTGNTTYYNVTTYSVDDPLIYLAANNYTSDLVDIGFMGGHNTNGVYQHSGLARDAGDGTWYLFTGLSEEGHENNVVDFANTTLATLRSNIAANSILLMGNTVATQANLTLAHDQANAARDQANTAYGQANDAYSQANTARNQANTAYGQANDAYAQANTGYAQANAAYDQANAAYADANTRVLKSGDTMTGQLIINTAGTGLTVANANVTNYLSVGSLNVTTNTVITSSSGQVVLDKFATSAHASAKYFVQANSGSDYITTEIILVYDGTNIFVSEYGTVQTGAAIGTFSADIDAGDARLLFTANNNVNTIRSVRYGVLAP